VWYGVSWSVFVRYFFNSFLFDLAKSLMYGDLNEEVFLSTSTYHFHANTFSGPFGWVKYSLLD
jgi:hypothetical protein